MCCLACWEVVILLDQDMKQFLEGQCLNLKRLTRYQRLNSPKFSQTIPALLIMALDILVILLWPSRFLC